MAGLTFCFYSNFYERSKDASSLFEEVRVIMAVRSNNSWDLIPFPKPDISPIKATGPLKQLKGVQGSEFLESKNGIII